jgi:hypothetical protein
MVEQSILHLVSRRITTCLDTNLTMFFGNIPAVGLQKVKSVAVAAFSAERITPSGDPSVTLR